jgi:hypothetical protein
MKASLGLVFLLVACATDGAQAPQPEGADAQRRLQGIRTEHAALLEHLTAAPADQLEACRATSGDCLLQVAESRGRLVSKFSLNACEEAPTPETKSTCVTRQLEGGGHPQELGEYYALESWCMKQLSACTQARVEQAKKDALDSRFVQRQQSAERSPEGQQARGQVKLVRARIEYLRATLPPGIDICKPDGSFEGCIGRSDAQRHAFEDSLRGESYDEKGAAAAYASLQNDEASCSQPEADCLSAALAQYGVFPESRKLVDRNLTLLADRQKLLGQVSEEAGQHCLSSSQKQHQADIVSAYVAYAREPVLYFRMQLDKSFLQLHEDEISCLSAGRKPAPATPTATAKR